MFTRQRSKWPKGGAILDSSVCPQFKEAAIRFVCSFPASFAFETETHSFKYRCFVTIQHETTRIYQFNKKYSPIPPPPKKKKDGHKISFVQKNNTDNFLYHTASALQEVYTKPPALLLNGEGYLSKSLFWFLAHHQPDVQQQRDLHQTRRCSLSSV